MGLISLPVMLRYGYDKRLAAGVIAASGTLAQIIPPSLVLIVLADQFGVSVGDMYRGALLPGLVAGRAVSALRAGRDAGASRMPPPGHAGQRAQPARQAPAHCDVLATLVPPLVLIFLVLGTIFLGVATPTEGGAMGAAGALLLALASGAELPPAADAGDGHHDQAHHLRHLHPHRLDRFHPGVPRARRRHLGGAPVHPTARRRARLSGRGQPAGVRAGVLPRLLRDRLHHRAAGGARSPTSSAST